MDQVDTMVSTLMNYEEELARKLQEPWITKVFTQTQLVQEGERLLTNRVETIKAKNELEAQDEARKITESKLELFQDLDIDKQYSREMEKLKLKSSASSRELKASESYKTLERILRK